MDHAMNEAEAPNGTVLPFRRPVVPTDGGEAFRANTHNVHRIIMRLVLKKCTPSEIADALGMHLGTISRIINSDIFRAEMNALHDRADERVIGETTQDVHSWLKRMCHGDGKNGGKVTQTLEQLIDNAKTSDRLKADICFDLLDREVGRKNVSRHEVVVDYAQVVQAAYARRQAMLSLPAPEGPVRFADHPEYDPPSGAVEPRQFTLEGFASDAIEVESSAPVE